MFGHYLCRFFNTLSLPLWWTVEHGVRAQLPGVELCLFFWTRSSREVLGWSLVWWSECSVLLVAARGGGDEAPDAEPEHAATLRERRRGCAWPTVWLYRSLTYEATRSTLTRAVLLKAQPARPWEPSWAWAHRAAAEGSWPDGTASLGAPAPWLPARRRHPVARARASLSGATRSGHGPECAQHGAPGGWWPA